MDSVFLYSNVSFGIIRSTFDLLYQNSLVILAAVITGMLMFVLYRSYISPDFYTKELTEIGFDHVPPGPDRPLRIARTMTSRRLGSKIPPPYPNGWFAVAESCDVKVGGVLAVDALGQNLCVYRGADGVVRCVDAYCPHLGANLAAGGNVCGNCIECPFHKWRFGADGALVSVPGVESVPKGVSIKSWETVEADGAVWIWYDAENRPPLWSLQDACTMQMRCRGRNIFTVNCHIQEIPENGADVAHLNAVHSESLLSKLGEKYPLLLNFIGSHYWTAEWSRGDHHTSTIKLTHDYKLMKMNLFHVDVDVTQIGPGHVRLKLQTSFGPVLISQSVTPIGPLQQKVVHRVFSPNYNAPLGYILNRAESYQFERDVAIWNNKRYVGAPAYVKTDKTIRAFRSWFSQFYSENSISFKDANNSMLEW
ncbi:cholesterol 7-desaturase nvd [Pectinophora gossypiella]|uniref:cholesterol 7-desaturase nvd n=1 Tax=Pectinophora gossypiella TaxID=13191 RepID=UPI00214DFFB3|nr:cholesterol 7-desaturase nvd [Pectinophora gossypiella]